MKWILRRDQEECKIDIQRADGQIREFSYVEMVELLYKKEKIEDPPEYLGSFSQKEKDSIEKLIKAINLQVDAELESSHNSQEITDSSIQDRLEEPTL